MTPILHILRAQLPRSVATFLLISYTLTLAALIGATLYCYQIARNDSFLGEYMFYYAVDRVLASILVTCIGAIVIDSVDRWQKGS